jgi:hypothetical protein
MANSPAKRSFWQFVWIGLRFIVFGVGGFAALWIGSVSLLFSMDPDPLLKASFAIPLAFVGGLMMMFGSGVWGRWAYLWTFLSVPIVMVAMVAAHRYFPAIDALFAKPIVILLFIAPMAVSYLFVKNYYKRRGGGLVKPEDMTHP